MAALVARRQMHENLCENGIELAILGLRERVAPRRACYSVLATALLIRVSLTMRGAPGHWSSSRFSKPRRGCEFAMGRLSVPSPAAAGRPYRGSDRVGRPVRCAPGSSSSARCRCLNSSSWWLSNAPLKRVWECHAFTYLSIVNQDVRGVLD